MSTTLNVTLKQIKDEFDLEYIYSEMDLSECYVTSADVNRPGMQLVGFFDYFDNSRIQVLGKVEATYLQDLTAYDRLVCFDSLLSKRIPALIITRGLQVFPELLEAAKRYGIPILRTSESSSDFLSALISFLHNELAPRTTRHGVLVEVYGEGILILGESGVGKSETAIELVKRGHRLVADDAVEIKRIISKRLVGTAPQVIRHFIELRGIGIIDVKKIFGMGSVKDSEYIDMIINIENWDQKKQYDRLGLTEEYTDLLGIKVTSLTIPVKPGRNLAVIVEVAAMNNRQKKMGYNAAQELLRDIGMSW